MLPTLYAGEVEIDDAMMLFVDSSPDVVFDMPPLPGDGFGLMAALDGLIILRTGSLSGPVHLEVRTFDREPPSIDSSGWEDVEEISVFALSTVWVVLDIVQAPAEHFDSIRIGEKAGPVRVRAHSRGRDRNEQELVDTAEEQYLVEIWPAKPSPPVVFKQTSAVASSTAATEVPLPHVGHLAVATTAGKVLVDYLRSQTKTPVT